MWLITDKRQGTSRVYFTASDAKRDVRRIHARNQQVIRPPIDLEEYSGAHTEVEEHFEFLANGCDDMTVPYGTIAQSEDLDKPFEFCDWPALWGAPDIEDLMGGPKMTDEEYAHGHDEDITQVDAVEDEVLL